MAAQDFGPAVLNRPHGCTLLRPQRVTLAVGGAMRAKDLRYLEDAQSGAIGGHKESPVLLHVSGGEDLFDLGAAEYCAASLAFWMTQTEVIGRDAAHSLVGPGRIGAQILQALVQKLRLFGVVRERGSDGLERLVFKLAHQTHRQRREAPPLAAIPKDLAQAVKVLLQAKLYRRSILSAGVHPEGKAQAAKLRNSLDSSRAYAGRKHLSSWMTQPN